MNAGVKIGEDARGGRAMTATQDAGNWDSLSPAELLNRLGNPSARKAHLLIFQALRHDFEYLWLSPADPDPGLLERDLIGLREAIEALELFADGESDRATGEWARVW